MTYLTSMATQTLALLWEFTDLGVREIRGKDEEIVTEYRAFVRESYEVVTADVDVDAVNKNVVAQFRGEIDLFRLVSPNTDLILCRETSLRSPLPIYGQSSEDTTFVLQHESVTNVSAPQQIIPQRRDTQRLPDTPHGSESMHPQLTVHQ